MPTPLTLGTIYYKLAHDNLIFPGQLGVGAAIGINTVVIVFIVVVILTIFVMLIVIYRKRIGRYFIPEGNVIVLLSQAYMLVACLANYLGEI